VRIIRSTALALLGTVLSAASLGCSASAASTSGADAAERIGVVKAALVAPTGTVSAATARTVLANLQAFQRAHVAFEALSLVGSGAAASCLSGSSEAGAYDLSCLTAGQVEGRLTFESHGVATDGGFQGTIDAKLENACVGDDCVNADAVIDVVPSDCAPLATLAVTADVWGPGGTDELSFGVQGGIGRGQLMPRVVYFETDGSSLIVDGAGQTAMPGPYLVSGSNRSFECTFLGSGGQCSGPTSFTF
jgi:hypothetical protein